MPESRYKTARAFRQSLEGRLNQTSKDRGVDLGRLRRRVAFERLLARLFTDSKPRWLLKGGYAIELRFQNMARATKDIDLSAPDLSSDHLAGKNQIQMIRDRLQDDLERDLGDWFHFILGEASSVVAGAPLGGARFPVEAQLDHRPFTRFNIDVGIGDAVITEPEWITGHELLSFAGISPAHIAVLPLAQQFAEKIHAYTRPRERENSRVRDLIDLVLLIEQGLPPIERVIHALSATFDRRATHPLTSKLDRPPESWRLPYAALAGEYGLSTNTVEAAYACLSEYWSKLNIFVEQQPSF